MKEAEKRQKTMRKEEEKMKGKGENLMRRESKGEKQCGRERERGGGRWREVNRETRLRYAEGGDR